MARLDLTRVHDFEIPLALADLHWSTAPGDEVSVRFARSVSGPRRQDLIEGAGFVGRGSILTRVLSLPDTVSEGMKLMVCGLNPSIYAAEHGIGFARPGNRFWPAALEAGLVATDRDPRAALSEHGVGMTDLVKRATRRADELDPDEYRHGLARIDRLAAWLRPAIVCFVGLAGWRVAVDRKASAGRQPTTIGDCTVYVMPSTSGLNAHATRELLAEHLRAAADLAPN